MFVTTLVLAAAAAAQSPAATVDTTREAFTKCLRGHVRKSLEAKTPIAEFEISLKSVCGTERDAFRAAIVAYDRAGGDSEANATENADMQVEDYHANFTDKYKDYSETNTMPNE